MYQAPSNSNSLISKSNEGREEEEEEEEVGGLRLKVGIGRGSLVCELCWREGVGEGIGEGVVDGVCVVSPTALLTRFGESVAFFSSRKRLLDGLSFPELSAMLYKQINMLFR